MINYERITLGNFKRIKHADLLDKFIHLMNDLKQDNPDIEISFSNEELITSIAGTLEKKIKKSFVQRALSKDPYRGSLNYIYNDSEKGLTVACDGRRIHWEKSVKYEDNCLLTRQSTLAETHEIYPDYFNIMNPADAVQYKAIIYLVEHTKDHSYLSIDIPELELTTCAVIQRAYFIEAELGGDDYDLYFKVNKNDRVDNIRFDLSAMHFVGKERGCVIMPCKDGNRDRAEELRKQLKELRCYGI